MITSKACSAIRCILSVRPRSPLNFDPTRNPQTSPAKRASEPLAGKRQDGGQHGKLAALPMIEQVRQSPQRPQESLQGGDCECVTAVGSGGDRIRIKVGPVGKRRRRKRWCGVIWCGVAGNKLLLFFCFVFWLFALKCSKYFKFGKLYMCFFFQHTSAERQNY